MRTNSPIPLRSGLSSGRVADDAQDLDWLKRMGVVVVDEFGAWRLTDLGKGAMERFDRSSRMPFPVATVVDG